MKTTELEFSLYYIGTMNTPQVSAGDSGIGTTRQCFLCKFCSLVFKDKQTYKEHTMSVHSLEYLAFCDDCAKGFKSVHGYKTHCKMYHSTIEHNFPKCKYCGKQFPCESRLVIHERCHTGERPFLCKACGKSYKQKRDLLDHNCKYT